MARAPRTKTLMEYFIVMFWGLCVYYIVTQRRVFNWDGSYIGGSMVDKLTARPYPNATRNTTLSYYKADLQTVRHEAYYNKMADGYIFQYGHCAAGFVWWAGMLLQLTGALRNASVLTHTIVGYASFFSAQALAFSGFYGLYNNAMDLTYSAYTDDLVHFSGLTKTLLVVWRETYIVVFWLHGAYLSLSAFVYLYYILKKKKRTHREWILRHCMVGFATLMKRITFGMWPLVLTYAPVDLHWLPSSIVKATLANVWIFIAHGLGQWLIYRARATHRADIAKRR